MHVGCQMPVVILRTPAERIMVLRLLAYGQWWHVLVANCQLRCACCMQHEHATIDIAACYSPLQGLCAKQHNLLLSCKAGQLQRAVCSSVCCTPCGAAAAAATAAVLWQEAGCYLGGRGCPPAQTLLHSLLPAAAAGHCPASTCRRTHTHRPAAQQRECTVYGVQLTQHTATGMSGTLHEAAIAAARQRCFRSLWATRLFHRCARITWWLCTTACHALVHTRAGRACVPPFATSNSTIAGSPGS
jgi:hypothetical protein